MRRPHALLLYAVVLAAVTGTGVMAADYYVDPGHPAASDGHPGTDPAAPWATLAKANATVRPGDTVTLAPGLYRESIDPAREGTAGNLITYRGATGTALDVRLYASRDLGQAASITRVTSNPFNGKPLSNVWKFTESAVLSSGEVGVLSLWEPETDADVYTHYVPNGANPPDYDLCWDAYIPITNSTKQEANKLPIPDSNAEGVDMVEEIPGSFFRDAGNDTVYFHTWNGGDPNTFPVEVNLARSSAPMGGTGDFGPCLPDQKDYVRLQDLACFGRTGNIPKPRRTIFLGVGNEISNVHVGLGKVDYTGSQGPSGLLIEDSFFCGGMHISPTCNDCSLDVTAGPILQRNTFRGADPGSSRVAIGNIKASSWNDPIIVRDNVFLNGTSRRPDDDESGFIWDWTDSRLPIGGDWLVTSGGDRKSEEWKRSGHGLFVGDSQAPSERVQYLLIERNIFMGAGDGVGIFQSDNVRVWNNTFGDDDDASQLDTGGSPTFNRVTKPQRLQLTGNKNLDIRNNAFFHLAGDAHEFSCGQDSFHLSSSDHCETSRTTADYNIYISPCPPTSVISEACNETLAQRQARGLDVHSVHLTATPKGTIFTDRRFDVNAYRPVAGSPLVDAGDPSVCSSGIVGSACDVGAFERGGSIGEPADCGDGVDNDGDGAADYPADFGCSSSADSSEVGGTQCGDGVDNDGDAKVDQDDPDCTGPGDNAEQGADTDPPSDVQNLRRTDTKPDQP